MQKLMAKAIGAETPRLKIRLSPMQRLLVVYGLVVLAILAFMTLNQRAPWSFTLPFRGTKVLALLVVAYSIALATLLFQTLTHNRILAPGVMGFDSLYIVLQTGLVFLLGSSRYLTLPVEFKWLMEVFLLTATTTALYLWLFKRQGRDLFTLILVGLVLGVFFRSLSGFMGRMMDPVEYDFLQDSFFATFNRVDHSLLLISYAVCAVISLIVWKKRHQLDVMSLGESQARNLGIHYRAMVLLLLITVSILVATSTALVGPVTFFGLLVVNLAYQLAGTHQHRFLIPMSAGLAMLTLIGGQAFLEHILRYGTGLSVIIEFVGGLFFIALLLRQKNT